VNVQHRQKLKKDDTTNNRPQFQLPVWKPKAKAEKEPKPSLDTDELEQQVKIQKEKVEEPSKLTQEQRIKARQRELDEEESRREQERLRMLERRRSIEKIEIEQRATQRERQLEELQEQARIADLENKAKKRAAERHQNEYNYEPETRVFDKLKDIERLEMAKERLQQRKSDLKGPEIGGKSELSNADKTLSRNASIEPPKNGGNNWKKKESIPVDNKEYNPPPPRAWPMTIVPPQINPNEDQDIWDTVPPQKSQTSPQKREKQSKLSTYVKREKKEDDSPPNEDMVQDISEKKKKSQPQKEESSKQRKQGKQKESEPIIQSSLKDTVDGEPKKEKRKFIPFNQKALDRAAGVKLSASALESNLQDQRDEVMALHSIFDKDFQKEPDKDKSDDQVTSGIYRIKINPEGAGNSFIDLRFSYSPTYPSHGPPGLEVKSESWLTPYAIHYYNRD